MKGRDFDAFAVLGPTARVEPGQNMGCGSSVPAEAPGAAGALAAKVSFPEFKEWYLKLLVREAASLEKVALQTSLHRHTHKRAHQHTHTHTHTSHVSCPQVAFVPVHSCRVVHEVKRRSACATCVRVPRRG
jgi:hypothetical protein